MAPSLFEEVTGRMDKLEWVLDLRDDGHRRNAFPFDEDRLVQEERQYVATCTSGTQRS